MTLKEYFATIFNLKPEFIINQYNELEKIKNASRVKQIIIPDGITRIKNGAFKNLMNLETLIIPDSVDKLDERLVLLCPKLTNLTIPNNIKVINNIDQFKTVKHIKLTKGIENLNYLPANSFSYCDKLEDVELPKTIKEIGEGSFYRCSNLKSMNLNMVEYINERTFNYCPRLSHVQFSNNLKKIKNMAFEQCENLVNVELPDSLESLGYGAFWSKNKINKKFVLPRSMRLINWQTISDSKYESIEIPNDVSFNLNIPDEVIYKNDFLGRDIVKFRYLNIKDNKYILSNKKDNKAILNIDLFKNGRPCIDIVNMLIQNCKIKDYLIKDLSNTNKTNINLTLFKKLNEEDFKNFILTKETKFFNNLSDEIAKNSPNRKTNSTQNRFILLYYALGGFQAIPEGNYAQRVGEFFKNKFDKGVVDVEELSNIFSMNEDLAIKENLDFNKERTDFFIGKQAEAKKNEQDNFEKMLNYEKKHPGFLPFAFYNFAIAQKSNTSNKGEQKQLRATVEHLIDCFEGRNENFDFAKYDVEKTQKNKEIINEIIKYFPNNKEVVSDAVNIFDMKSKNPVMDDIIGEKIEENEILNELKNSHNIIDNLEKYENIIDGLQKDTLNKLVQYSNSKFTFEMLSKSSPVNLILGKICDCCSHIRGNGADIMQASILDNDIQNLVIRNKSNEIVAKSTLYINRLEGYGLFNNVEVAKFITEKQRGEIYKKYKLGISVIAEKYNQKNPNNPLKEIRVGMGHNDLEYNMVNEKLKIEKDDMLQNFDYLKYSHMENFSGIWQGDTNRAQAIIWENKNLKETKQK